MKKFLNFILLGILVFSSVFFVFEKPVGAEWPNSVVISEVMHGKSSGSCANGKKGATCEFVELYNPTSQIIDFKNLPGVLKLKLGPTTYRYIKEWQCSIIKPGEYFLLVSTDYEELLPLANAKFSPSLSANSVVSLITEEDSTNIIDSVSLNTIGLDQSLERNLQTGEFFPLNTPSPQSNTCQIPPQGPTCGNGIKEENEQCDGTDLAGQTCISHGFVGGTLSCDTNCIFNTSNCTAAPPPEEPPPPQGPVCGNNLCETGEEQSCPEDCPRQFLPSDVVINEFVSDPTDEEEEWVELYNNTEEEIDLTGWKTEEGSGAQTNLSGTIGPKGFFVVEKIKGYLNNDGDIIKLIDPTGRIINQVAYGKGDDGDKSDNAPVARDPNSVARIIDGYDTDRDNLDFKVSTLPTKGEPNKLAEEKTYTFGIILNELLPNPKGDDSENEFIELKNITDQEIDLEGWKLEDASGTKFVISSKNLSSTKIPVKGFFVLYRKDSKIALNNSGKETLKLYQPNDNLLDFVEYSGTVKDDYAYARDEKNSWFWTTEPTPGKENIIKKVNEPPKAVISAKNKALVNEEIIFDASDSYDPDGDSLSYAWDFGDGSGSTVVLVKHIYKKAGKYNVKLEVKDSFGLTDKASLKIETLEGEKIISFSPLEAEILVTEFLPNPKGSDDTEWIEIFNAGDKEVNLEGWFLDDIDGGSKPYKIKEETKILPGEYLVFARKETKIALNNNFDSVRILDPEGNLFFEVSYEKPKEGFSYALDENNDWSWTSILTPGKKNIFSPSFDSTSAKASVDKKATEDKGKFIEVDLTEIRNQDVGDLVKIQGVVSVEPGILGVQIFYLAGSGIQIYSYKKDFPNLKVGDRIEVIGELAEFKGETRIKISSKDDIKILKNEDPPQAKEVKTGEIDEDLEGNLVLVQGQLIELRTNYFYLDDGSGEVKVYLKATANIKKPKMKDGEWLKVIGIVSQYGEEYRLLPRYQNDIELIKKPTESDKFQATGALSETKPLFSKINPFSKVNQSEKIKYLSLSALTLLIVLIGLLIKRKKQKDIQ